MHGGNVDNINDNNNGGMLIKVKYGQDDHSQRQTELISFDLNMSELFHTLNTSHYNYNAL